jgi:hypothetical protein
VYIVPPPQLVVYLVLSSYLVVDKPVAVLGTHKGTMVSALTDGSFSYLALAFSSIFRIIQ